LLGLVDHILDERLVDDGQHFLRHRLGGGQDTGAETGDGEDGFADFHGSCRNALRGTANANVGSRFAVGTKGANVGPDGKTAILLNYWKPGTGLLKARIWRQPVGT